MWTFRCLVHTIASERTHTAHALAVKTCQERPQLADK